MSRTLLVPLDGSPTAERALPVARELARRLGAALRLVRVLPPDAPPVMAWAPVATADDADAALPPTTMERDARADMDRVVAGLAARPASGPATDPPVTAALRTGEVVPTLLREAADVELVVMTSKGRGLSGTLLGSVARDLVRDAEVPVLVVHPAGEPSGPPDRILLPLEGSPQDAAIVERVAPLGAALKAAVVLLRVVSPPVHRGRPTVVQVDRDELRRLREEAEAYLAPIRERLAGAGLDVRTLVVADERPGDAIIATAAEQGASLIAMATRARRGIDRLRNGSVAEQVLRRGTVDVLLYHP